MIRYDQALPLFVALVCRVLQLGDMSEQVFLRDAFGRLTLVVPKSLPCHQRTALLDGIRDLAPWVDTAMPAATPDELFDPDLLASSCALPEYVVSSDFTGYVRLIERRLVGQDWLRPPQPPIPGLPPIAVFSSYKGGVGRSTALSVSAAALSRANFNVLVVDLDLEAPGLGSMLLDRPPRFGTLDYFVETGLRDMEEGFIDDLYAASALASGGLIHVSPAVGSESIAHPQNVLGKIARAYVERLDETGQTITFLDRTRDLVRRLCLAHRYDAVLIDARAGLNEATAAAVLGLGAQILLFGVDTRQTFAGYRYFLAHLQKFRPPVSDDDDWRQKLQMVHARAQSTPGSEAAFRDQTYAVFSDTIYDVETGIEADAFNFDLDDASAPHYGWPIADDPNFIEFDPLNRGDQLSEHLYDRAFGVFLKNLMEKLGLPA